MEAAGQILFVFGLVFTVYEVRQNVSVQHAGWKISGAVGPVMMVLGVLLWWIF
jgi:uncharacterized membrane protein